MDKLPLFEAKELNNSLINTESFNDELYIAELDGNILSKRNDCVEYAAPLRMNALLIVITIQGNSHFKIDYRSYDVGTNHLIIILPTQTIQLLQASQNFKGRMVAVSKSFIDSCLTEKKTPSMLNYMTVKKNPCIDIEKENATFLSEVISSLKKDIKRTEHHFHKSILQNGLSRLMIEIGDVFLKKHGGMSIPTLSRKEELLNNFLSILFKHCKEQHEVSFYADKLCISPQYLSLILKEQTGKSASKWIDEALVTEAKILLKLPNTTVQQVANILNFSDQSTFGKFFKKQMKISPLAYRKSL
jgi:AraC-type DNA-binding domain-containing proteins